MLVVQPGTEIPHKYLELLPGLEIEWSSFLGTELCVRPYEWFHILWSMDSRVLSTPHGRRLCLPARTARQTSADTSHGQMVSAGHQQVWPPSTERKSGWRSVGHWCTSPAMEYVCSSHNNVIGGFSVGKNVFKNVNYTVLLDKLQNFCENWNHCVVYNCFQ